MTIAAGALGQAGLIRSARDQSRIAIRQGLEDFACECYEVIRGEFAWLDDFTT